MNETHDAIDLPISHRIKHAPILVRIGLERVRYGAQVKNDQRVPPVVGLAHFDNGADVAEAVVLGVGGAPAGRSQRVQVDKLHRGETHFNSFGSS